jgi:hypothetical protein
MDIREVCYRVQHIGTLFGCGELYDDIARLRTLRV